MKYRFFLRFSGVAALVFFAGFGCGSRNLYRHVQIKNPVLERGYAFTTRDQMPDAGAEPVEFGSPIITKDTVYLASETRGVEAYERSTFRRKWQIKIHDGCASELLLDNDRLFFGANDGNFYAVDAEFGRVLWKYETKAPVFARPFVAGSHVLLATSDDVIYCLERDTGKWVWHYKRSGNYITTVRGNSTPVVDGNLAYVGFSDGYFVALNAADGNLVWEQKIHKGTKFTDVDATALIDNDHIYIPSYDGELYALDRLKGRIYWHIDVGGSKKVLMDDKQLFLGSSNGNVYSINKDTGRILWKFELDEGTPTNLLQRDNYLAFGSSRQYFYAIHKGDGRLAYRFNVGFRSGFVSAPAQSEKDVFAFSNFGNLYVFRWKTAAAK